MGLRRNLYALNAAERGNLIDALMGMKQSGIYDEFVRMHVRAMAVATPFGAETPDTRVRNAAHRGPAFLPWHREFLRRFEHELERVVPGVTLPYWDWATDAALPDLTQAPIWGSDLLGGNGDANDNFAIKDGPFIETNWQVVIELGGPVLRRRFGILEVADDSGNVFSQNLAISGQAEVDAALAEAIYDAAPWDTSAQGFRRTLEGWNPPPAGALTGSRMHNIVHLWVGGGWVVDLGGGQLQSQVGSMVPATSPNDPVFFLHHCFIDKIWADWQDRQLIAAPGSFPYYQSVLAGPVGHNLFDGMYPWGHPATPASAIDYRALGYEYEPTTPPPPPTPAAIAASRGAASIELVPAGVPIVSPFQ